jgi:poly-gamma-glutamate synthesis protein (capsule biosynthesis protein)
VEVRAARVRAAAAAMPAVPTPRATASPADVGDQSQSAAITVAVTGDVLPHSPVVDRARQADGSYDFAPLLAGIRAPIAGADLALCHLETPLARGDRGLSSYPVFNAPPALAEGLAAVGYDGCSVASNHAFDQGVDGVDATLDALDAAGLGHAGTARTAAEARRTRIYSVDRVDVAHLSYTYGLNGFVLPDGRPWLVDRIDVDRILADARRARRSGADVTLVSLHWGQEYVRRPTSEQVDLAEQLLASAHVDVLVGHHAHVVQPVDRVHGKVVVYGLGNLLSNQSSACCAAGTEDGVIVELTIVGRRDGGFAVGDVTYRPTLVAHPSRRVVLVDAALADPDAASVDAAALRASRDRTRRAIGDVAEPTGE